MDDTFLDARVACIKFGDEDHHAPLDLIMFTGRVAPCHNANAFQEFLEHFREGDEELQKWVHKQPSK